MYIYIIYLFHSSLNIYLVYLYIYYTGGPARHLREPVPRLGRFRERLSDDGDLEEAPRRYRGVAYRPVPEGTVLVRERPPPGINYIIPGGYRLVEAGTVVVNPLYYQEEDNDVYY